MKPNPLSRNLRIKKGWIEMSEEIFEQTGKCRVCGKRGNKRELIMNDGLCWGCRGDEIRAEATKEVKG